MRRFIPFAYGIKFTLNNFTKFYNHYTTKNEKWQEYEASDLY